MSAMTHGGENIKESLIELETLSSDVTYPITHGRTCVWKLNWGFLAGNSQKFWKA